MPLTSLFEVYLELRMGLYLILDYTNDESNACGIMLQSLQMLDKIVDLIIDKEGRTCNEH